MTPEQMQEANAKAQKDAWLADKKLKCRENALAEAGQIIRKNGGDILAEAQKIYEWLTKDLE